MSTNITVVAAQAVFVFPLILITFLWQSESSRSIFHVTMSDGTRTVNQVSNTQGRNRLPTGSWGGNHVALEVSANGASIEFDCAHGAINESFTVDNNGRFDLRGTYEIERPGPQRIGRSPNSNAVRYTGSVNGTTMTLTITLIDRNEVVGTFTLTHGRAPRIVKCL